MLRGNAVQAQSSPPLQAPSIPSTPAGELACASAWGPPRNWGDGGGGMGGGGMGGGNWGAAPGGMGGGGGWDPVFGSPGSGQPASIGDCISATTMLFKKSIPVLAAAWFAISLLGMLFCCPQYLLAALPALGQADLLSSLGSGFALTCISLLRNVGMLFTSALAMGLMKPARVAMVEGVDAIGGIGGALKMAASKLIASLVILIIAAILATLCFPIFFVVFLFMMLVAHLVIAVEISIGEAFSEAFRLAKAAWLPLAVMGFVWFLAYGICVGCGVAGVTPIANLLGQYGGLIAVPCTFFAMFTGQFLGWIVTTGTAIAIETKDANVQLVEG